MSGSFSSGCGSVLCVWVVLVAGIAAAPVRAEIGIATTAAELASIPTAGPAWDALLAEANLPLVNPNLWDNDDEMSVRALAKALVYARTGDVGLRDEVRAIYVHYSQGGFIESENFAPKALPVARKLLGYIVAADLVGLEPAEDQAFRTWLDNVRYQVIDGRTLVSTHQDLANNWGPVAGATRAAAALYLGDTVDFDQAVVVFRGWLGDRDTYAGFSFGGPQDDLSWQPEPSLPVAILPVGATLFGRPVDGVLPEEMRRHDTSPWVDPNQYPPFPAENYCYETLQGALVLALILERNGHPDVWDWSDQALLRALRWLHAPDPDGPGFPPDPEGDDGWLSYIARHAYPQEGFPLNVQPRPGKNFGWTDWTHACLDFTQDTDGDGVPDSCDSCPGLADPSQADRDLDGVGDVCDNCVELANPRVVDPRPFQTTTGGQLDDDADGYGNACDGDFDNFGTLVASSDLQQFLASYGKRRAKSDCGTGSDQPCDAYDMNGLGTRITSPDLQAMLVMYGERRNKGLWVRCDSCPLVCEGHACPAP